MDGFDTSKGFQDIFVSEATKQLLVTEFDADLPFRENVYVLESETIYDDSKIELVPSGHMLGSVQVSVERSDGARFGYSSDFQWPIENVIQVDALVVDSTYGNPESTRRYSQAEAENAFASLLVQKLKNGPVYVLAHRGTLQRALQVISAIIDCPIVGSARLCREVQVYREFGYGIATVLSTETAEAQQALAEGRFLRLYGLGDGFPVDPGAATAITLSAFMSAPDDPVLEYTDRSYRVAMSNHADFEGTVEYIRATGARYVVTDNCRGGHAVELAVEIKSRLGVEAEPSRHGVPREWGV
jgi:putative mRNA 3-end processing factor